MKTAPLVLFGAATDRTGVEFQDDSLSLSQKYVEATLAAGGLPWVFPCVSDRTAIAEAVRRSPGVMLTGGDDVAPRHYCERLPAKVSRMIKETEPARDLFELMLLDEVFRQQKPLLAICRGHQILNVALGGTLYADVALQRPRSINHKRMHWRDRLVHAVACSAESLMRRIAQQERFYVNSAHHQAVSRLAKPLRATAVSRDGIVECLELTREDAGLLPWLLSVQFHPERLFARHEEHLRVFTAFVRACRLSGRSQV